MTLRACLVYSSIIVSSFLRIAQTSLVLNTWKWRWDKHYISFRTLSKDLGQTPILTLFIRHYSNSKDRTHFFIIKIQLFLSMSLYFNYRLRPTLTFEFWKIVQHFAKHVSSIPNLEKKVSTIGSFVVKSWLLRILLSAIRLKINYIPVFDSSSHLNTFILLPHYKLSKQYLSYK